MRCRCHTRYLLIYSEICEARNSFIKFIHTQIGHKIVAKCHAEKKNTQREREGDFNTHAHDQFIRRV